MGKAVGIIEVYGLAAAFVACDAGCKAANVTVENFDKNKRSDYLCKFKNLAFLYYNGFCRI